MRELEALIHIGRHPNIVSLVGACTVAGRDKWTLEILKLLKTILTNTFSVFFNHKHIFLTNVIFNTDIFLSEPLCVVTELVSAGSLDKILRRSHVPTQEKESAYANIWSRMTERELLSIASDVANGMKHLESKQVILRKKRLTKDKLKNWFTIYALIV